MIAELSPKPRQDVYDLRRFCMIRINDVSLPEEIFIEAISRMLGANPGLTKKIQTGEGGIAYVLTREESRLTSIWNSDAKERERLIMYPVSDVRAIGQIEPTKDNPNHYTVWFYNGSFGSAPLTCYWDCDAFQKEIAASKLDELIEQIQRERQVPMN